MLESALSYRKYPPVFPIFTFFTVLNYSSLLLVVKDLSRVLSIWKIPLQNDVNSLQKPRNICLFELFG